MRKEIPMLIMVLSGLLVILSEYIAPVQQLGLKDTVDKWFLVSSAVAVAVGVVALTREHLKIIHRRRETWPYSILLLFTMYGYIAVSLYQTVEGQVADWIYDAAIVPMGATMYGMVAFWITSAAYRVFRVRTWQGTILLIAGIFTMIGHTPIGPVLIPGWDKWAGWFMDTIVTGTYRAITIGAYLGAFTTAMRILLGLERAHMGGAAVK